MKKKKDKDKIYKDIKLYNMVMSNIWKLITFVLIGILGGYILNKKAKYHDINYMLFSILFFTIIGIVDFFISIIRESKRLEKKEKQEQQERKQDEDNQDSK